MKIIPEMRRTNWIRYLRFYYKSSSQLEPLSRIRNGKLNRLLREAYDLTNMLYIQNIYPSHVKNWLEE
jgi:hypothetical protein